MSDKAVPALLAGAVVVMAATVLLTTRGPDAGGGETAVVGQGVGAIDDTAPPPVAAEEPHRDMDSVVAPTPGAEAPPTPSAVGVASAPPEAAGTGTTGRSEAATKGLSDGTTSGNETAEAAVSQVLSAAGLPSSGLTVMATAAEAPAATTGAGAPADAQAVPSARDLTIPVPTGARVPVVFYDDQPRPAPQQAALDRIADEFSEIISNPPAGYSQQEVWEAARKIADERYSVLYGFDAFNQMSMRAAKEALKEKKAAAAATGAP